MKNTRPMRSHPTPRPARAPVPPPSLAGRQCHHWARARSFVIRHSAFASLRSPLRGSLRLAISLCSVAIPLLLSACATRTEPPAARAARAQRLAGEIAALSPRVDRREADALAREAVEVCVPLRARYGIRTHRWIHNVAIYWGLTARGSCWHWATDITAHLRERDWRTLDIHRVQYEVGDIWREHHALAVAPRGARWDDSITLDAWRNEGVLWFGPTKTDYYRWEKEPE